MYEITIDTEICKKCGSCAKACPVDVIQQTAKATYPLIEDDRLEYCIGCGQCAAICPQGAIRHSEYPMSTMQPIPFEQMPTAEQALTLLKTRRSIRAFREKEIPQEMIETIIDAARFAPSGHNSQSTEFLVVQDKAVLNEVSALVIEYLKFEIKRFSNPFFKAMALAGDREKAESGLHEIPGFKRKIRAFESGADPILNGAPVLLAFHARRTIGYADVNAQLALQNASLAAHALGIGHFYTGWVIAPSRAPMARAWKRRIPDLLGIPSENVLYGALAMGFPTIKFKNMIERKSPITQWV